MSVLNREQLLARKPTITILELSDSGESVAVRRLNPLQFESIRTKDPKDRDVGMQLAACICDLDGKPIFDQDNPAETKMLAERFTVGESQDIIKAALANPKREDIKKNLEATNGSGSPSDLP